MITHRVSKWTLNTYAFCYIQLWWFEGNLPPYLLQTPAHIVEGNGYYTEVKCNTQMLHKALNKLIHRTKSFISYWYNADTTTFTSVCLVLCLFVLCLLVSMPLSNLNYLIYTLSINSNTYLLQIQGLSFITALSMAAVSYRMPAPSRTYCNNCNAQDNKTSAEYKTLVAHLT